MENQKGSSTNGQPVALVAGLSYCTDRIAVKLRQAVLQASIFDTTGSNQRPASGIRKTAEYIF